MCFHILETHTHQMSPIRWNKFRGKLFLVSEDILLIHWVSLDLYWREKATVHTYMHCTNWGMLWVGLRVPQHSFQNRTGASLKTKPKWKQMHWFYINLSRHSSTHVITVFCFNHGPFRMCKHWQLKKLFWFNFMQERHLLDRSDGPYVHISSTGETGPHFLMWLSKA